MKKIEEGLPRQVSLSFIYRLFSMIPAYLSVRILFNFLGYDQYGLWVTINSLFSWFILFDIGLGTGLQNLLIEAYSNNNRSLARRLISTTYAATAVISIIVFLTGILIINFLHPGGLIDTLGLAPAEIKRIFVIMLVFVSASIFLNLYVKIFNSLKKTSTALLAGLITQLALLSGFFLLTRLTDSNKLADAAITKSVLSILIMLFSSIILFKKYPDLKPSVRYFDKALLSSIAGIGIQFFIIHLCWALINSTDNIIISNQLGSAEVTAFSLVYKIITLGKLGFFLLLTPFWPQFSEYYHKSNYPAMKSLLLKYFKIMSAVNILICTSAFFVPLFIKMWIGTEIKIRPMLIIAATVFVLIDNAVGLFSYCLNAVSRIKIQMYLYIAGAILNIPLSLFLVNLSFGSAGAVLASCICYIPLLIVLPIQVKNLLKV